MGYSYCTRTSLSDAPVSQSQLPWFSAQNILKLLTRWRRERELATLKMIRNFSANCANWEYLDIEGRNYATKSMLEIIFFI